MRCVYAPPALLIDGRVGFAGPGYVLEPSWPGEDLPASGHAWLSNGLLLVTDGVPSCSEPGRVDGDAWTMLDVRRGVYPFGQALLNDGFAPAYGGVEQLDPSPPSDDRRASDFVYPRLHLLPDTAALARGRRE